MSLESTFMRFATWLVLVTCMNASAAAQQADRPADPALSDIAVGRTYVRGYCSRCHGLDAKGGQAPDLSQRVLRHGNSDEALARNIRDGIAGTGMSGFGWSEERIRQVISFLREQQRSNRPEVIPGDAAQGRLIFEKHKCDACHWTPKSGGRRGPDLAKSRGSLEYLRRAIVDPAGHIAPEYRQLLLIKKDGRVVQGMRLNENSYYVQLIDDKDRLHTIPKVDVEELHRPSQSLMPDYQKELSSQDLDDLIAYLFSLRQE